MVVPHFKENGRAEEKHHQGDEQRVKHDLPAHLLIANQPPADLEDKVKHGETVSQERRLRKRRVGEKRG